MIEVQTYVMLTVALFFTFIYGLGERQSKISVAGIISFVSWWILGLLWLFLAAEPSESGFRYGTYSVSLFFFGIGLILLMLQIIDLLNIGKKHKEVKLGELKE